MALSDNDFDYANVVLGPATERTCACCGETVHEGHYAVWVVTNTDDKFFCEPCVPDLAINHDYENDHPLDDNAEIPF